MYMEGDMLGLSSPYLRMNLTRLFFVDCCPLKRSYIGFHLSLGRVGGGVFSSLLRRGPLGTLGVYGTSKFSV